MSSNKTSEAYRPCDVCGEILPGRVSHLGACERIRKLEARVAELERRLSESAKDWDRAALETMRFR